MTHMEWLSLGKASLVFLLGIFFAKKGKSSIQLFLEKIPHLDPTIGLFLANAIHSGMMILILVMVLAQFGVQTTSIVTVLGTAGLALGLALQGTLANCASGLMILFLRPIKIGEFIEAGDICGKVESIGLFSTQLCTLDGIFVTATNSQLWSKTIKNYGRNPTRRIDCLVGIAEYSDIEEAKAVLYGVLKPLYNVVLSDPVPLVVVSHLTDQGVYLTLRCWTKQEDYWPTHSLIHQKVKEALVRHQIKSPIATIHWQTSILNPTF